MDRYRYYRSILSVMLATDSIDLSVKNFSFLTDSIDHRSEKKNFSSIKSNHRLKIFFSSKDHRSNQCFLQLIDYRYRSSRCFFRHRCPSMYICFDVESGFLKGSRARRRLGVVKWHDFTWRAGVSFSHLPHPPTLVVHVRVPLFACVIARYWWRATR